MPESKPIRSGRAVAPKQPKTKPAAKPKTEAEIEPAQQSRKPDWLTAPVPEAMYQLSFRTEDCDVELLIDLSRSEFIQLKQHVAVLRGFGSPAEAAHAKN